MARSRTRRRSRRRSVSRNAKGHFVTRRRRSRRRNPSGFIKVGRRWKKITKYARRRRRGSRRGQIRAFKFPRRYRRSRSRRRVRSNPVVVANPSRRRRSRRARRNPYSRRRSRRVYRNPVMRLASDPIGAIKNAIMSAFSVDTLETLGQMGVGFGGSLWLGKLLVNQSWVPTTPESMPYWKIASTFGATLGLTGISSFLKKPSLTARILTGGLFATLWQALSQAVSGTQFQQYVPTLSGAENDEFRRAIESEVLRELRGGVNGYLPAAGAEGYETYLRPAGIEYLRAAGSEAYLTNQNLTRAENGMGAYLTEVGAEKAQAGLGEDISDEFSRRAMPERF